MPLLGADHDLKVVRVKVEQIWQLKVDFLPMIVDYPLPTLITPF